MIKEYICTLKYIMAIEKFDLSCDFTKKYSNKFFIQMNINALKKKIVENFISIERWQEICWRPLY